MKRIQRVLFDQSGALVVEFGLIVPILFLLVFGIVDFGRAYFTLNNLAAAVREGARYGAVLQDPAAKEADIKQRVVDFSYTFGGARLGTPDVSVAINTADTTLHVTANYTFRTITPLVNLIGLSSIPMQQTAVFRLEYGLSATSGTGTP
jgi:Flp pilus assembly protein TadG